MNGKLPESFWPYGEFLVQMADFDILTNQTRYKDVAQKQYLPAFQGFKAKQSRYGYAATRAYLAYNDPTFLAIARDYWETARPLTLSEAEVLSGKSSAKTKVAISRNCTKLPGVTLAGGTLHDSGDNTDLIITVSSTSDYLALSVSLATITGNQTYTDLARQLAQFVLTVLYRGDGRLYDSTDAGDSKDCPRYSTRDIASDTGSILQGLSMLGLATKNQSLLNSLRDISRVATTNTTWHSGNGILSSDAHLTLLPYLVAPNVDLPDNPGAYTQHLLRGYFELAVGNDTPSDLKTYLQSYIGVQYNAAVDQAASQSNPNIYGSNLQGPPGTQLDVNSQLVAITVLLGGLFLSDNKSPTTPTVSPIITSEDHNRTPIGAIVGGTIGGVVALVLVALGYLYIRRRRQSRSQSALPERIVEPYPAMNTSVTTPLYTDSEPRSSLSSPVRQPTRGTIFTEKINRAERENIPPRSQATSPQSSSSVTDSRQSSRLNEATTADLIMILNDRLRNERFDINESPPEYSRGV
ncbi:hypothetical protein V5O48_004007 [Marasmius crinis-equi]|uniref:Glycoside hydrolase family 76 protein n=1 Tax=Marasmius crinis-equi TaxID=585013 RepID=A0ABR3FRS2_9AGAR